MKKSQFLFGDGLKARAVRSTLMTGLNFGGQNVLRLGGNLVLTRLLFPEAFGIMAIVQVVKTGVNMFSDLGINASIVQDARGEDQRFLDTAFTIQVIRGIVLWLMIWAVAAPVAEFYEAPILAEILPIAGLTALFQGFNSTKLATANRELRLGRVTVMTLVCQAIGLAVTIGLSIWLKSVWALVIGGLVPMLLIALLSHVILPGAVNRFALDRDAFSRLFGFGKYIFIATVAGFLINQGDRAILGKFVSLDDLAFYNIAFFLATVPLMLMRQLSDKILFPLYRARPPAESEANYNNIARARFMIISSTMAMTFVLAIGGHLIIDLLYDARYSDAGLLLVLIALAQLPVLIIGNYGASLLALGFSGKFAIMLICLALIQLATMVLGALNFGLLGVTLSPIVAMVLYYPVVVRFTKPYGAWVPRHDILFSIVAVVSIAVILWVNDDLMGQAWNRFGPQ